MGSFNSSRIKFWVLCCFFFSVQILTAGDVTIDVTWDNFNVNQYDGVLVLPAGEEGSSEFVGGFKRAASSDGHVIVGEESSFGLSSMNRMHWEINGTKNGVYKFYLFCKAGGTGRKPQWPGDVNVAVSIDGNSYNFTPVSRRGEVWEVLYINGASAELIEKQVFYPFRHIIYGYTRDALTGEYLSGVRVTLFDAESGKPIPGQSVVSEENGFYGLHSFSLGRYILQYQKEKYITVQERADFILNDLPVKLNPALSPVLKETQLRVTLEWGDSPRDLDAHLLGPNPSTGEKFHISYNHMHEFDHRHFLDIDDTDRFGPETITIGGLDSGEYTFSIHDFTNRNTSSDSWKLASSGGIVRVYRGSSLLGQFSVPEKEGNLWRVFSLDGSTGRLTGLAEMLYIQDSDSVY